MVQLRAEKYFWIISFVPPLSNSISENNRDGCKTGLTKADKRNHVFYKKREDFCLAHQLLLCVHDLISNDLRFS